MPVFESPALYIDFSRLPPPKVVEEIDYDALVKIYQAQVLRRKPELARAVALEQSPTNVVLQAEAYGEMIVRARINAAARALMLPFAKGADLDNLAAGFQLGFPFPIVRMPLVAAPRPYLSFPEDWETDAAFRRRVQLVPEAYSSAGTVGGYIFHGLSADSTVKDISVTKINDRGGLKVAVMNSGSDPTPTKAQLTAVTARLFSRNVKPLTDVLSIAPARVETVDLKAEVTLYPGPDASLVMTDITKALDALRAKVSLLGRDLTLAAINSALMQEGVQNAKILSPSADVVVGNDACVFLRSGSVIPTLARGE